MTALIDPFLNRITMYRLTLLYAGGLVGVAFLFALFHLIPADPTQLAFSGVLVTATCWATNRICATLWRVPVNTESIYITALILVLIMPPVAASDRAGVEALMLASSAAIASKFILVFRRRHIFNPVALGALASMLALDQPATWWVGGNLALLPFVLAGGLLVVRKVQRFDMVGAFIATNLAATLATTEPSAWGEALNQSLLYSPLLFLGFAMLTEPLTAPQAKWPRIAYGAIVGILSSANIHVGDFYPAPEMALLIGNLFAFAASPKGRPRFTLLRIEKMAAGCYDFVFRPDRFPRFAPGQYLDWTLDVPHPDDRGNRRPFTVASAPGEPEVRLGVKFYKGPSAFKRGLLAMKPGDTILGSAAAGSFTLPRDPAQKLAFIAGGIGVTPFRSMIAHMIQSREPRDAVMFYGNNTVDEIAYAHVFDQAERELGIRTIYAVAQPHGASTNMHVGFIDARLIEREVPDYAERTFYISGPRAMVVRFRQILRELGISRRNIKTDFFPGFA
jgi:ferredoxin-NADP reductase